MQELLFEWHDLWLPQYKQRELDLSTLLGDVKKVILFTGCRRAGKTFLMFQLIDQLHRSQKIDKKDIVYLNFEDERVEWDTRILTELLPTLVELYGERDYHLFLDEIHHIPDWDRWVRRIYDRYENISLYLTSSSSKLSSKEIPNSLRGRTLVTKVFPLSFKEFASFKEIALAPPDRLTDIKRSRTMGLLNEYLKFGGFPEVVLESSERRKKAIIQDYFRTIIALDICERYNIKNTRLIHDYVKLILGQTTHSTNKMYNTLRSQGISIGKEILLDYTHYLEEVYFSFFVPILSSKVKNRLYYPRKVYFIDNSFINHITTKFSDDVGRQMENIVYLQLLRKYESENIFYWKNPKGQEIDFVIMDGVRVVKLIQVCHNISDISTKERELRSLVSGARELECTELYLISRDHEGEEEVEGRNVRYHPLFKWLQTD